MIIDFHAHLSSEEFGGELRLYREYDRAGICFGILVPGGMIDVRRMSDYITGQRTSENRTPYNELVEDLVGRDPRRFGGFYCVDPDGGSDAINGFEKALKRGFLGLKLAPLVHQFSLTCPTVHGLLDVCRASGAPVYTHTVFSPAASTRKVGLLARRYKDVVFVIGHMGFGPVDQEAIGLAASCDNVFLETSGGSYLALEQALETAGSTKLLFGSEYPLHNPLAEIEKVRALDLPPVTFDRIMGTNASTVLRLDTRAKAAL